MDIGIGIGILGIIVAGGIAYWQNQKAKKAEARLASVLNVLPSQITQNLSRF